MSFSLWTLPPLSPDYSGVASVFHDLGALMVIHDASGCTGTYTGYDEPRWFGSSSPVFCSGLREMDAILGDDDKLLDKITGAFDDIAAGGTKPPCVVLVGSPVPMVIGFDFRGFASLLEKRLHIPVFAFPTNGLGLYDAGQRMAYLALAKRIVQDDVKKQAKKAAILGASALDGFDNPAIDYIQALLESAGFLPGPIWGSRSSYAELQQTGEASVNVVLSAAAIPLAEYLRQHFNTPYIAGLPIGTDGEDRFVSALHSVSQGEDSSSGFVSLPEKRENAGPTETFIVGEALLGASIRNHVHNRAAVMSFFSEGTSYLDNIVVAATEEDAEKILAREKPALVVGDPLIEGLLDKSRPVAYIPVPHRAVSGRLYEMSLSALFGSAGDAFFKDIP